MAKITIVTRDEFEVENLDEVSEVLPQYYQLDRFDLLNAMRAQVAVKGELFVYMHDASNPSEGVVEAPEFYLDTHDDTQSPTWGPIRWKWTDGSQVLEEPERDSREQVNSFEKMVKDTNRE